MSWPLLKYSSQKRQPGRRVAQGCAKGQKARLGSLSSRGRPGKAQREAGLHVITGEAGYVQQALKRAEGACVMALGSAFALDDHSGYRGEA